MNLRSLLSAIIAITLAWVPITALADGEIDLTVETSASCDLATFKATASGGASPFILTWEFGDGESLSQEDVAAFPAQVEHVYPAQGDYAWRLAAVDAGGLTGETGGTLAVEGPTVTLGSDPFPPLLVLQIGQATVAFTAEVTGGTEPYEYTWDLDDDGQSDPAGDPGQASFTYSEAGKYLATVTVTDGCGLASTDTLPVVIIDLETDACHPMAQRIADGVNTLFPSQAEQLYTCEDIYAIFSGDLTGFQVGFGRMWHAYHLAQTIEDLTWEEIRDWHLDGNGWGGLVQLNRFADALDEIGVRELFDMVLAGDASIQDIRHSFHAVLRYEASFEDALARLGQGMSPGELGRFYRTASELGVDGMALDQYLADGISLQELSHAARVADRSGADWEQVAEAHTAGYGWGEIGQAQRMAMDGDWMSVLAIGVRETRDQLREQARDERDATQLLGTAEKLADRYGVSAEQLIELYHGECEGSWGCVRRHLRDQQELNGAQGKDVSVASRLARHFGVSESEVWALLNGSCSGDWKCVRSVLSETGRGGGPKPKD